MKCILTFLSVIFIAPYVQAQEMTDAVGLWLNEDGSEVVEIFFCEDTLCGKIHWLKNAQEAYDVKNPDFAFQNQPLCGLDMMWGFARSSKNTWTHGKHYMHSTGETKHSNIMISDKNLNEMVVHSFLNKAMAYDPTGMLGTKEVWTKVSPDDYPRCNPKFRSHGFDALEALNR